MAANLSDCFRMNTAIVSAMVDYPIGDLIAERVRAVGVSAIYKHFVHDGVTGPNMATVYSDQGLGVRAPVVFYTRCNEAAARLARGDCDWDALFSDGVRWFHSGGIFASLSETTGPYHRSHASREEGRRRHELRSQLQGEALEHLGRLGQGSIDSRPDRLVYGRSGGQRGGSPERPGHPRPRGEGGFGARSGGLPGDDRRREGEVPVREGGGHRPRASWMSWIALAAGTASRRASSTDCSAEPRPRKPSDSAGPTVPCSPRRRGTRAWSPWSRFRLSPEAAPPGSSVDDGGSPDRRGLPADRITVTKRGSCQVRINL